MKYLLLILTITLAACSSTRGLDKKKNPSSEKTELSGRNAAQAYIHRVEDNAQEAKAVTAKVKMSLRSGNKDISASGSLRMRRDDVIQLSLTVLGFEVARMEFTPQDVLVIDRYHKQYVRATYSDLDFLRQAGLDFSSLQSLFWAEIFQPGTKGKTDISRFDVTEKGTTTILTLNDAPSLDYIFSTLTSTACLEKVTVKTKSNSRNKGQLDWNYANHTTIGGKPFPLQMEARFTGAKKDIGFTLTLNRVNNDDNWEGHTNPSHKYTERKAEEILGKLFNH